MAIWDVAPLRFAPAFRALGVCEHIWPFSLRDIWATLLSPKGAEMFVAQMAGHETSLPLGKRLFGKNMAADVTAPVRPRLARWENKRPQEPAGH